ncbi:hypothetical protein L6258_00920 [Candidatus Parcubacteria bacterium]|nr:hypothetical protein [Candidatus Parcubacteria bacterium]
MAIVQMVLDFLQVASYGLVVFWSFKLFKSLPWERFVERVRFYYVLLPALALAGLAFTPLKVIWNLLLAFPLDYSKAWIPLLVKFLEGLGFVGLLVFLCLKFNVSKEKSPDSPLPKPDSRLRQESGFLGAVREQVRQRFWIYFGGLVMVLAILGGVYYYLSSQGYIVRFSLFRPEYLEYHHESPKFSFSYPSKFVIDKDEDGRFGEDYLVGIKLPSDNRVGCDVRAIKGNLSLEGDLLKVTENLAKQISQGAEGFEVLNSSFVEVGGEKAIKLEITFKGPLGGTMRTDQLFTSYGGMVYTLICGITKDTYGYFAEDFGHFYENFRWE